MPALSFPSRLLQTKNELLQSKYRATLQENNFLCYVYEIEILIDPNLLTVSRGYGSIPS